MNFSLEQNTCPVGQICIVNLVILAPFKTPGEPLAAFNI